MGLIDIKKGLKSYDKEQLLSLIADLYRGNGAVKEYLDFYFQPNEAPLFEKYKQKVIEAFYPKRGFEPKLILGKKAITDFKKLGVSAQPVADLMLVYVETGIRFTLQYGDIDEPFSPTVPKQSSAIPGV